MSNIDNWKAKIGNVFKSKDVVDGIDNLEKSISQYLIPTLSQLEDARPFNSEFAKKYDTLFLKELAFAKFKFKGNEPKDAIELMFQVAANMLVILPWVRHELRSQVITTEGMDLKVANLMQMIELADWANDYITNYVNTLTVYEVLDNNGKSTLTPTIEESIENDLWIFVTSATILLKPLNDIKSAYGRIPALIADYDKFQELSQSIGLSKVDPLNLSTPPFPLSLFFYPQMSIADYQYNRFEKAESNYKAINYRLALLKRLEATGESDAATEKQIDAHERELVKLERYIQRKKEKWNLGK